MGTAAGVLAGILGVVFLAAGGMKLIGAKPARNNFHDWRYPRWFVTFTGAWEAAGALLLLIGIWNHGIGAAGAGLVGASMAGALYTHLVRVPELKAVTPSAVLLATAVTTVGLLVTTF